jgi:hypothetical protein
MDPGNLLYGTIVATATFAVGASRGETAADMTETMATTLVVYWLAHIYLDRAGTPRGQCDAAAHADLELRQERVRHPGGRDASGHRGERPAVAGITLWLSVLFDLGTDIVVLVLAEFLAGLRAGMHGWRLSAEPVSAAIMGGILAALLVSLHRH